MTTGLDSLKSASIKVVHKPGEFLGNKIADAVTKSNGFKIVKSDENARNVEEIIIPPKKRRNIKRLNTSNMKMEHCKISKLFNDSTVS